jgi:Domain of unknown function (DUF4330)
MKQPRKINFFDYGLIVVILLALVGFGLARSGLAGVNQAIEGVSKVAIDVYITGLKTRDLDLFKVGEKASITVRNVPLQPAMTITQVTHNPKQVAFLSPDGKKAIAYPDPSNAIAHDFLVTVVDEAERTKDGFVVRGQKIKVGNPIELEGFKYRAQGVVVDVRAQP